MLTGGHAVPSDLLPFMVKDGVKQVVGPLALGPGAFAEVPLAPHAQPFQHGGRRRVPRVAVGDDPVLARTVNR